MEEKKNLPTTYNPKEFEERIYKTWEEKKYFTPVIDKSKKPFSIVMPPPNITGRLHLGHALDNTLQDMLIRFKRMQGYCTLWLPGQDHASIATEVKVENELLKQGLGGRCIGIQNEKLVHHDIIDAITNMKRPFKADWFEAARKLY